MMKIFPALAFAALMLWSASASAQQYRNYDAAGRLKTVHTKSGNVMSGGGSYAIRNGDWSRGYVNGRHTVTATRRGNIGYAYDTRGRLIATATYSSDGSYRMYDRRGRYAGHVEPRR
jgi:hypothetical protein